MPRLTLPAEEAYLTRLMGFVTQMAEASGFNSERIRSIELTTEEALVNVIQHAYPETAGNVSIDCQVDRYSRFIVEITDDGIPFDGLGFPDPDLDADLTSRKTGGLGVFLIKKMADHCRYRREGERNILTLGFEVPGYDGRNHADETNP